MATARSRPHDRVADSVSIYLIRHAKAGDRALWSDPDHLRPLTKKGRRQAEGLVRQLRDEDVKRVVSSRYMRCVETVEPLAADRGVEIDLHDALAEGASLGRTLALIEESAEDAPALCTHGDVVENVIGHLSSLGVPDADASRCKKGSTWILEIEGRRFTRAKYLPPPD